MIRYFAAIGAIAGLVLQLTMMSWAALITRSVPGPLELLVMCVMAFIVAGAGAILGSVVGIIVATLLKLRRKK